MSAEIATALDCGATTHRARRDQISMAATREWRLPSAHMMSMRVLSNSHSWFSSTTSEAAVPNAGRRDERCASGLVTVDRAGRFALTQAATHRWIARIDGGVRSGRSVSITRRI